MSIKYRGNRAVVFTDKETEARSRSKIRVHCVIFKQLMIDVGIDVATVTVVWRNLE